MRAALRHVELRARALEAETKKAEAAAKKKAAKKGRRAASYGSVQITTRSTKAKVRIDGRAAALTPLSRPIKLKPGRHHIEVVKDGKRMSKTITVQAGKVSRVSFSL